MTKNKPATYGTQELDPDEFNPKFESIRISAILEGDLLDTLKARAKEIGVPYQTLMKELLRMSLGLEGDAGFREKMLRSRMFDPPTVDLVESLKALQKHATDVTNELRMVIKNAERREKRA